MENVLDLYQQPYDPKHPVICYDEKQFQKLSNVIADIPIKPGSPRKQDSEYKREGTCCILIAFEPKTGKRIIQVKDRRTKMDYAYFMKDLVQDYPEAEYVKLVQDNLNTHTAASFYEAFPPQEAFDLMKKFEYHYTPIKGSWLNMVEIEISALSRQCLDRRIGDIELLAREVSAWERERNRNKVTVHWEFSKEKAREKLQRHYLKMQNLCS
jgi:DDE superfamily endonuclease